MISIYQFAILVEGFSLLSIAGCTLILWLKFRKLVYDSFVFLYFTIFLFMSGCNHFIYLLMIYYPVFPLFTILVCITAIVSVTTAFLLPLIIMRFIRNYVSFADRLEIINRQIKLLEQRVLGIKI